MNIKILAVGKIKDRLLAGKIDDYADKLRHDAKIEMVEIKDADPEAEGEKILTHLERESGHIIVLDELGMLYTSQEFAQRIAAISKKIVFIIGGPFGLSDAVKKRGTERIALSKMTFTHEMAKVFLMEQLYRALSIINNRKYHKS